MARELINAGHECIVIAPSLIPTRPGDHIKTDKRDATTFEKMHRAGELTSVWMPDASHEAVRDLVRAREMVMYWRNKARQALSGFLLRRGYRYGGRSAWTVAYWRWLAAIQFEHPAQQIAMQEYILTVQEADARHDRLVKQIEAMIPTWAMAPLVAALQTMGGIALITAATIVAEIGEPGFDFRKIPDDTAPRESEATGKFSALLHFVNGAVGKRNRLSKLLPPDGFLDRKLSFPDHRNLLGYSWSQ